MFFDDNHMAASASQDNAGAKMAKASDPRAKKRIHATENAVKKFGVLSFQMWKSFCFRLHFSEPMTVVVPPCPLMMGEWVIASCFSDTRRVRSSRHEAFFYRLRYSRRARRAKSDISISSALASAFSLSSIAGEIRKRSVSSAWIFETFG